MTKRNPAPATPAYLENPRRIALILGAFPVIAVPLAIAELMQPFWWGYAAVGYLVLLGGTHFLITLGVYLFPENLRYFSSSPVRVITYFVVPPAVMAAFFAIGFFNLNAPRPDATAGFILWVLLFTLVVRALDFVHVVRQSFGMLQLFKGQTRAPFPRWTRRADNTFFLAMAALQLSTFFGGLQDGEYAFKLNAVSLPLAAIAGAALAVIVAGFAAAARGRGHRSLWLPGTYFLFQASSAALAAWRSELYAATLAMHYVEYHVMMFPRLFAAPITPASGAGRAAAWVRQHKMVFYAALVVLSFFAAKDNLWPALSNRFGERPDLWLMFNLLNGIFVTHFFIEAFIWKFRNPYFRDSLAPVYFARTADAARANG